MTVSSDEVQKLSVAERLELIEILWDSIAEDPDALPLTEAQRLEIDRRLDSYARRKPELRSWNEVRARLERDE
ncbi:MAG TPA: addiction module protein [Chloroflexota bacterium]|nr:addiction module protein [Chloroflexota bacterium]